MTLLSNPRLVRMAGLKARAKAFYASLRHTTCTIERPTTNALGHEEWTTVKTKVTLRLRRYNAKDEFAVAQRNENSLTGVYRGLWYAELDITQDLQVGDRLLVGTQVFYILGSDNSITHPLVRTVTVSSEYEPGTQLPGRRSV